MKNQILLCKKETNS